MTSLPPHDLSTDPRTAPFDLGAGAPCLLMHGFTGTPYEVRPLGEALARRGYHAVGPRLAGHGFTAATLAASTAADWYDGVRRELLALRAAQPEHRVHLIGLSIGAMLALRLAAEHADSVATLTLLAPAARFQRELRLFFAVFRFEQVASRRPIWPKDSVGLVDPVLAKTAPRMREVPTIVAREVVAAQRAGWAAVKGVQTPSMLVVGGQDHTVSEEGAFELVAKLRPPPVEVLRLARSGHVLPLDVEREELCAAVGAFLERRDRMRG